MPGSLSTFQGAADLTRAERWHESPAPGPIAGGRVGGPGEEAFPAASVLFAGYLLSCAAPGHLRPVAHLDRFLSYGDGRHTGLPPPREQDSRDSPILQAFAPPLAVFAVARSFRLAAGVAGILLRRPRIS